MKVKKEKYGLSKHLARFGTEEKCTEYLVDLKWDGRPKCHHCGNQHLNYFITTRNIWKCSSCKKQFSVKKNTIFEDSKLPLTIWFKAIYYFTTFKRGLSSCQLAKLLQIEQRTAWFVLHRLREVIKEENDSFLSGIVEIDEMYISPKTSRDTRRQRLKKAHDEIQDEIHGISKARKRRLRGHALPSGGQKGKRRTKAEIAAKGKRIPFEQPKVILGMTERGGRVVLRALGLGEKYRSHEHVYPHLRNHISTKSVIYTDQANLYDAIASEFNERETVNHKNKEYVRGDVHVNSIENVWKHFNKAIEGTWFWMSIWHLQRYLNEHAFHWNIRALSEREKVNTLLQNLFGKRVKYKDLIIPKSAA